MKQEISKFKVYYFVGDFWSSKGEERRCAMISARDEFEAEYIFKRINPNCSFGWVEKYCKEIR